MPTDVLTSKLYLVKLLEDDVYVAPVITKWLSQDLVILFVLSLNWTHLSPKTDGITGTIIRITKVASKEIEVAFLCILAFVRGHCSSLHWAGGSHVEWALACVLASKIRKMWIKMWYQRDEASQRFLVYLLLKQVMGEGREALIQRGGGACWKF